MHYYHTNTRKVARTPRARKSSSYLKPFRVDIKNKIKLLPTELTDELSSEFLMISLRVERIFTLHKFTITPVQLYYVWEEVKPHLEDVKLYLYLDDEAIWTSIVNYWAYPLNKELFPKSLCIKI